MTRFGLAPRGEELLQLEADTLTHSHSSLLSVRFGFVESPYVRSHGMLADGRGQHSAARG
jgi:hypothetical protein